MLPESNQRVSQMMKRILTAVIALAVLFAALATIPPQKVLAGAKSNTVILIHGWNANSSQSCNEGPEFGDIETYFHNNGIPITQSVKFYNADYNCDYPIQEQSSHCTGWYDSGSNDGTVNEDIRHTTCLLAWYIYSYYNASGHTVEVVAHSMGGVLIRQAMFDTPYVTQFPPILQISDVVTAGAPQQGILSVSAWLTVFAASCASPCVELEQLQDNNPLMVNLNSASFRNGFGLNPQGANGGTDWTNMSSAQDPVMYAAGGTGINGAGPQTMGCNYDNCSIMAEGWMPGAKHFIGYPGPNPNYDHGGYLTDSNTTWNARMRFTAITTAALGPVSITANTRSIACTKQCYYQPGEEAAINKHR